MIISHYLRLLFYFHFLFRIRFHFSFFKKKYLAEGVLVDLVTTKKFYKNLKSIAIFNYWYQSLHRKCFSNHDLVNTFYYSLLWTLQDEQTEQTNGNEALRLTFMERIRAELKARVSHSFVFEALGTKLVEVQLASQIQKEKEISIGELEKVEEEKAGYSFPFYASLTDFPSVANQFQILYDFGVILQHIDDVLDIHEDIQENIKTMANTLNINDFEVFFSTKINHFLGVLRNSKASDQTIIVSIICFAIGFVQIQNLKKMMSPSQELSYQELSREQLICDMRKYAHLQSHLSITKKIFQKYKRKS